MQNFSSKAIQFHKGNILDRTRFWPDALINPVNCVGVMGKGLALQFKRKFPDVFEKYKRACIRGEIKLGEVLAIPDSGCFVINFPTKHHWRDKSKIEKIELGLEDLVRKIQELEIKSISIPALGCGEGGLDWDEVKPLIVNKLSPLNIKVMIFEPH